MADNQMTLNDAMAMANSGDYAELSNTQLADMNQAFADSFTAKDGSYTEDVQFAANSMLLESEDRIEKLSALDTFDPAELESIAALASSISFTSNKSDLAKSVLSKIEAQQKAAAEPESVSQDAPEFEVSDETPPEDAAKEEEVSNEAPAATSEEIKEEGIAGETQEAAKEDDVPNLTPEQNAELEAIENTPDDPEMLKAFDKEYGLDTITEEQLDKNAQFMDRVKTYDPFALNEEGTLAQPEFQAEYDAFQNMVVTNDEGEALTPKEQAQAKEDLRETAMFEAETLTRGTAKKENLDAEYMDNIRNSLQKAVVVSTFASDKFDPKTTNKEKIADAFVKATNEGSKENPPKVNKKGILGYASTVNGEMNKVKEQLGKKFKDNPSVKKMSEKAATYDKKMSEKHPKLWKFAKRVGNIAAKRLPGIAMYTVVGATAGPIGLAVLAGKSGYDAYKGMKGKATEAGMSLGQYAMAHKGEVLLAFSGSALAMVGASVGLGSSLGIGSPETAKAISPILKVATRFLAVGPKAGKAAFHGAKMFAINRGWAKGDVEQEKAAMKEAWNQTVDATLGLVIGSAINSGISNAMAPDQAEATSATNEANLATPQMSSDEMAATIAQMGLNPEIIETMDPSAMQHYIATHQEEFDAAKAMDQEKAQLAKQDKDGDGITDDKDIDHGQGWASANETQLDRVMDVDPRGVNAVLGDGEWHSSAELKEMMEKGEFSEEQMKAIHGLAVKDFDEKGHLIDPELKGHYEELAKQEQEKAEAAKAAAEAEAKVKTEPEETKEQPVAEPQEPQMTAAEQKMYNAILNTIGKNEDMSNPEVRASVEGMAQERFVAAKEALVAGDENRAMDIIKGVHEQGEKGELEKATKEQEGDGRKLSNAKEDLTETKDKLDQAKEALSKDPDNEKLQKEVNKLEKEFDKDSIKLDDREIKEERSELKDQIKQDEKNLDRMDKARETVEKVYGISSAEVDKQLAAAGIDGKNLPENTESLPKEVQNLIAARGQYDQVDKLEESLKGRIEDNTQQRDHLKEQHDENKDELRNIKKDQGLSTEGAERLAGQSNFTGGSLDAALSELAKEQTPPVSENGELHEAKVNESPIKDKPQEAPVYQGDTQKSDEQTETQKQVDKFLAAEVAKGNLTAEEAKEMAPQLVAKAESDHSQQPEQTKEQTKEETKTEEKPKEEKTEEKPKEEKTEEKPKENEGKKEPEKETSKAPANEAIAEKIDNVVNKAETQFAKEVKDHQGSYQKIDYTDGSTKSEYATMDGTIRTVFDDAKGGATISAYSMEGDGYKINMEPDGTQMTSKTDIYGVHTTETRDASGKVVESNQESKTMEEKLAFRQERLGAMKEFGILNDKEVNEAMDNSRKELMADKAKELSGRGDVRPTQPVQQTKLDLTNVGKGQEK